MQERIDYEKRIKDLKLKAEIDLKNKNNLFDLINLLFTRGNIPEEYLYELKKNIERLKLELEKEKKKIKIVTLYNNKEYREDMGK